MTRKTPVKQSTTKQDAAKKRGRPKKIRLKPPEGVTEAEYYGSEEDSGQSPLSRTKGATGEGVSLQPTDTKGFFAEIMADEEAPDSVRVQAAKALDAIHKREAGSQSGGLASLTRAQVRAEIARVRAELGL